jgi:hypothetical protein
MKKQFLFFMNHKDTKTQRLTKYFVGLCVFVSLWFPAASQGHSSQSFKGYLKAKDKVIVDPGG